MAIPAAAALVQAQALPEQARHLLQELDTVSAARVDPLYAIALPGLVRTALAVDDRLLARSLIEGVPVLTPIQQHTITVSRAQVAEADGDYAEAAALYADAAERWEQFGNLPERAYALLGQGRCLQALDDPSADQPLNAARELFAAIGYRPALAETQALLDQRELAAS